jgi:hypothetical protein
MSFKTEKLFTNQQTQKPKRNDRNSLHLTALLTAKPSKHTIIALAILGTILALSLITGVHAGRPIDGIG